MRGGRIIADSDEEDGLSPVPSPAKPTAEWSSDKPSDLTTSTDPVFFQSVYLAQQQAAVADAFQVNPAGSEGQFEHPGLLDGSYRETQDTLPPVLNPENDATGVSGLDYRGGGTPDRGLADAHDPWAMPSSPAIEPPISLRKRKLTEARAAKTSHDDDFRAPGGVSQSPVVIDLVSPDRRNGRSPRTKRPRRSYGDEVRSDNDGEDDLALPTENDANRSGSKQLYVEPSRMTESQKQQYEEVNLYGLSPLDEPISLSRNNHLGRSSGSATIAYPTPTQYRSNGGGSMLPPTAEPPSSALDPGRAKKRRRLSSLLPTAEPESSPDVIAAAEPPRNTSPGRHSDGGHREEYVEPEDSCDEDWNEKDFGIPRQREERPARQKRNQGMSRKEAPPAEEATALLDELGGAEASETVRKPAEPKKRGPKKKSKEIASSPKKLDAAPVARDQPVESAPPPKRKRGRPKKSESDKSAVGSKDDSARQAPHSPGPEKGKESALVAEDGPKRARSTDAEANATGDGDKENVKVEDNKKALAETSEDVVPKTITAQSKVAAADLGTKQETTKPRGQQGGVGKDKDGSKSTANAGLNAQAAKPVYRVGLSKRTRIAPLLKCIRKS